MYGVDVSTQEPLIAILCKTPTGAVTALQVVNPREKAYRRFRTEIGNFLPVYLASSDDFDLWELTGNVILVEGVFDRVAVKRCGVQAAVFALLGLGVSFKMARFLARHSNRVWLMLDQDEKGKEASVRISNSLKAHGVSVEYISYSEKDPADWLQKRGVAKMRRDIFSVMELRGWG